MPYARGREVYRSLSEIINEVKELVAKGYKEIVLIAQNVNSYHDGAQKFPDLLKKVIDLPGEFWVRFSSSHPKDLSDELIALLAEPKVCPHLHLAVQSGDDEILEKMNRKYTAFHFRSLIAKARAVRQDLAVTTDVIVGFPGESEAQFENTAKLFRELSFDLAYTAQYSPRPGTVSAKMVDDVSREEKHRREKVLTEILQESGAQKNREYLGREVIVLVDGINRRGKFYGKTASYKTVLFTAPEDIENNDLIGNFVPVKILSVQDFGLEGELAAE